MWVLDLDERKFFFSKKIILKKIHTMKIFYKMMLFRKKHVEIEEENGFYLLFGVSNFEDLHFFIVV